MERSLRRDGGAAARGVAARPWELRIWPDSVVLVVPGAIGGRCVDASTRGGRREEKLVVGRGTAVQGLHLGWSELALSQKNVASRMKSNFLAEKQVFTTNAFS